MAKLTRKSYQRKAMVIGATAFAGMALVATGFAAWVISSSATKNVDGNVTVGTITDKSIKLEAKMSNDFSFDSKEGDYTGHVRCDGKNFEKLTSKLTGTYDNAKMVNSFTVSLRLGSLDGDKFTADEAAEKRFQDAQTNKYIVLPECFNNPISFDTKGLADTASTKSLTIAEDVASFSYDIAFKWGDHFQGQNPSEFYDDPATGGKTYPGEAYKDDLAKFYEAMTGEKTATDQEIDLGFANIKFVVIVNADTSGAGTASN